MPRSHSLSRRLFVIGAAMLATGGTTLGSALASPLTEGAEALVRNFTEDGVRLLEDRAASSAERAERFRALLQKYFATDAIARWVLGRHWGQFSDTDRQEYRQLFENLVVYGYAKRFGEYTGERLQITRTLADGENRATVFSEIARPQGGQPIRVDWRVGAQAGAFRITDVVIENISLAQTWRSDFASTIQQGGPTALLQSLRERTRQLKLDLGITE